MRGRLASGRLSIVDTPGGERMRFVPDAFASNLEARVVIFRPGAEEVLELAPDASSGAYQSIQVPAEPHEFKAELRLASGGDKESLAFAMSEPHAH